MLLGWNDLVELSKQPQEILFASLLMVEESDIDFESIEEQIQESFSNLKKFIKLCLRIYSDYENISSLDELPNLLSVSLQSILLNLINVPRHPKKDQKFLLESLREIQRSRTHQFARLSHHFAEVDITRLKALAPFQCSDFISTIFDLTRYKGQNKRIGSYGLLADYLNTHFCLLREDLSSTLRHKRGPFKSLGSWRIKRGPSLFPCLMKDVEVPLKVGSLLRINSGPLARVAAIREREKEVHLMGFGPLNKDNDDPIPVEECTLFFEPYYQVFTALYQIKTLGRYEKYLVQAEDTTTEYADLLDKKFDFSALYETSKASPSSTPEFESLASFTENLFKRDKRPSNKIHMMTLCEAKEGLKDSVVSSLQATAILRALSHELTLIHGPPGTGKSFIGAKIMRLFNDNRSPLLKGPILLVAYTNMDLDKMLEKLSPHCSKIIRVGHQSTSSSLIKLHEVYTLLKENEGFPSQIYKYSPRTPWGLSSLALENTYICSHAHIVGITTTSLATNYEFIQLLAPQVILVDEAGEILESHLLAALSKFTRHFILIGDHMQLRPRIANPKISSKNGLDLSLFERLLLNAPKRCIMLTEQRRCSLRLFKFVSSMFYNNLTNHPSKDVEEYVPGSESSIQLFNHSFVEDNKGAVSKSNVFEAEMCLSLAQYLVRCGNPVEDISLLAAYSEQVRYLRKNVGKTKCLKGLHIETVDNFQGRENEIIIMSLVRSESKSIGFLSVSHRVTAALTRAKKGLFLFGNFDHLSSKSQLWTEIKAYFENENLLQGSLRLHCPRHRDKGESSFSIPSDFFNTSCLEVCETKYRNCNHLCSRFCNFSHANHGEQCDEACSLKCSNGHPCSSGACHGYIIPCPPCKEVVDTLKLPCGHSQDVNCFTREASLRVDCQTLVQDVHPLCGHPMERPCWNKEAPLCKEICGASLKCGHTCKSVCHPRTEHGICKESCLRMYPNCKHSCTKKCFEDCSKTCIKILATKEMPCGHVMVDGPCGDDACLEKCNKALPCGHGHCRQFCYECKPKCDPGQCKQLIQSTLECGHLTRIRCSLVGTAEYKCMSKCKRSLPCGHPCPGLCWEPCLSLKCTSHLFGLSLDCGHKESRVCGGESLPCAENCSGFSKKCGHPCLSRKCSDCFGGRLHFPCEKPCERMLLCGHVCQGICGGPCPPCNRSCLISCEHEKKCISKCDSLCFFTNCKSACEWSCSHEGKCGYRCSRNKCNPCKEVIDLKINGQEFKACCYGSESHQTHPENVPRDDGIYIQLPDCGHWILEVQFLEALVSQMVGVIRCPNCHEPVISWIHGYKREMTSKNKIEIVKVQDVFFFHKTNLLKKKSGIRVLIEDSSFSSKFKKQVISELPQMNLTSAMSTELKAKILEYLDSFVISKDPELYSELKNQLEKMISHEIGKDYLLQFRDLLVSKGYPPLSLSGIFLSFEPNAWKFDGVRLENLDSFSNV